MNIISSVPLKLYIIIMLAFTRAFTINSRKANHSQFITSNMRTWAEFQQFFPTSRSDVPAYYTRAATMIYAFTVTKALTSETGTPLRVYLVGADREEGNTFEETYGLFEPFVKYFHRHDIELTLIGPNLHRHLHLQTHVRGNCRMLYFQGLWEDYVQHEHDDVVKVDEDRFMFCFNAGIWVRRCIH